MVLNKSTVIFTILLFFNSSLYSYIRTNSFFVDFGNTFTHECIFTGGDLASHPADGFVYNHHSNNITTPICTTATVDPNNCFISYINKQTACPSHFTTTCCDYAEMKAQITITQQTLASKEQLIDGGNTQNLLTMIQQQKNMGVVKNALIAASPYLSDKILLTYVKKNNPYPPGHILQVMLANSPLTDTVLNSLINRQPPLPPGILNQILAAQTGTSARKELEQEISYFIMQFGIALNKLNRAYLNDTTIAHPFDSIIAALLHFDKESLFITQLANAYMMKSDYTNANAVLNVLSAKPYYSNYVFINQLYINLAAQGKDWFELLTDSLLRLQVEAITNDTLKPGFLEARAVLSLVFGTYFPEHIDEIVIPSSAKKGNDDNNEQEMEKEIKDVTIKQIKLTGNDDEILIYPNPASNKLFVKYSLPSSHNAIIKIYDIIGHKRDYNLVGEKGIIAIDLTNQNNGIYYYFIIVNNNTIAREKIIVVK